MKKNSSSHNGSLSEQISVANYGVEKAVNESQFDDAKCHYAPRQDLSALWRHVLHCLGE